MTESKKKQFRDLRDRYGLTNDQFFKSPQEWIIIKRDGVDQIIAKAGINVDFEVVEYTPSTSAAVKATGTLDGRTVQSYGEAVRGKYPEGNSNTSYILAMAEKRGMSRVVLKLTGFYALGVFSEDEADDFDRTKSTAKPIKDLIKDTL